jgi:hypothetical protein
VKSKAGGGGQIDHLNTKHKVSKISNFQISGFQMITSTYICILNDAFCQVLTTSGWNPPPGHRRMHGDLLYVYVITLEDKRVHVTASTRGFYVNQTTEEDFNPRPASSNHLSHSLVDLLNQVFTLTFLDTVSL